MPKCLRNVDATPCGIVVNGSGGINTINSSYPISSTTSGSTATITHDNSGVIAGGYGNGTDMVDFVVDSTGHITTASTTPLTLSNSGGVGSESLVNTGVAPNLSLKGVFVNNGLTLSSNTSALEIGLPSGNLNDVLTWDGNEWISSPPSGSTVSTSSPLTGDGSAGNPITFANGTVNNQFLVWDGAAWTPQTMSYGSAGGTFSLVFDGNGPNISSKGLNAGTGINIVNNGTSLTIESTGGSSSPATPTTLGTVYGKTNSSGQIGLGYNCDPIAVDAIAIGLDSTCKGTNSIAIGENSNAGLSSLDSDCIAIGRNSNSRTMATILIGTSTVSYGDFGIGIGAFTNVSADFGIAFGYDSLASGVNTIAIGRAAEARNTANIAIGHRANTPTSSPNTILMTCGNFPSFLTGNSTSTGNNVCIACGNMDLLGNSCVIGGSMIGAGNDQNNNTVIGMNNSCTDVSNVCILGYNNTATTNSGIVIGNNETSTSGACTFGSNIVEFIAPNLSSTGTGLNLVWDSATGVIRPQTSTIADKTNVCKLGEANVDCMQLLSLDVKKYDYKPRQRQDLTSEIAKINSCFDQTILSIEADIETEKTKINSQISKETLNPKKVEKLQNEKTKLDEIKSSKLADLEKKRNQAIQKVQDTHARLSKEDTSLKNQVGLIVEEVCQLGLPGLIVCDGHQKPQGINYNNLTCYLLDICKRQQTRLDEQQIEINQIKTHLGI